MESIGKLRGWLDYKINHYDHGGNAIVLNTGTDPNELYDLADEIEREIAKKYMELPVDMNEEPIHPGDLMTSTAFDRNAIDGKEHVFAVNYDFWVDKDNCTHIPAETRHVKPRTIEDVLDELSDEIIRQGHQAGLTAPGIIAKFADELRGMGVGE